MIIDEASMLSLNTLQIIDFLLKSITRNNKLFGGKSLLLHMYCHGTPTQILSPASSFLHCKDSWRFSNWPITWDLTKMRNSINGCSKLEMDSLPIMSAWKKTSWQKYLWKFIMSKNQWQYHWWALPKIILNPKNRDALQKNNKIMPFLHGETTVYKNRHHCYRWSRSNCESSDRISKISSLCHDCPLMNCN